MADVIIVPCPDYRPENIKAGVEQIGVLGGGIDRLITLGRNVLIKPNLLAGEPPERAVTTHPELVRSVAAQALARGAKVTVGDSPGFGSLTSVAERTGIAEVCRELNLQLARFQEVVSVDADQAKLISNFELAREVVESDFIINLAKMKTHGLTALTGAVKNLFGCVVGLRKAEFHFRLQKIENFSEMLLDLILSLPPMLHIVDAVDAMEGWGPRNGQPRRVGLLVAGDNPVAVDWVLALLMNVDPLRVPYLAAAALRGWEGTTPGSIRIIGEDIERFIVKDFDVPNELGPLKMRVPRPIVDLFRKSVTPYPKVTVGCQGCGICLEACPAKVIKLSQGKAVIQEKDCIRCFCCQEMCPYGAINLRTGWLGSIYRRRQGRRR